MKYHKFMHAIYVLIAFFGMCLIMFTCIHPTNIIDDLFIRDTVVRSVINSNAESVLNLESVIDGGKYDSAALSNSKREIKTNGELMLKMGESYENERRWKNRFYGIAMILAGALLSRWRAN